MDMPKIVVMLMRFGTKPVPFGPFDSYEEAREWAETELSVADDETYTSTTSDPLERLPAMREYTLLDRLERLIEEKIFRLLPR